MRLFAVVLFAALVLVLLLAWTLQPASVTQANAPYAITQLTNDHAVAVRPAWSPDNRSIAYQSNRDSEVFHIYLMNADGSNQRALTKGATDDRHPVWTLDGKSILFDSFDGAHREIWIVNAADGSLKQITHVGALANFASPSPDGKRLAFYLFKDEELNIFTSQPDGSDVKQVTSKLASAKNNQCTFACHQVAWSADSQTIAYSGGEHQTIWTARSDGTNAKRLFANNDHSHFPWFLPDGRLGYVTEHVQPASKAWTDAWAYDFKTGESALLQGDISLQGPFEWSNDGVKVLFHSPRGGTFDIYMIDLAAPGGVDANPASTSADSALPNAPLPIALALAAGIGIFAILGVVLLSRFKRNA